MAHQVPSSPSRGTWIEIPGRNELQIAIDGRPPHGGRGLKSETINAGFEQRRRPPHGGRGLKSANPGMFSLFPPSRPPHGGRGLKYLRIIPGLRIGRSSPSRGTWIEIVMRQPFDEGSPRSSPSRGTWIEMPSRMHPGGTEMSSPSRGTWIEMYLWPCPAWPAPSSPSRGTWIEIVSLCAQYGNRLVVPLTGDVD